MLDVFTLEPPSSPGSTFKGSGFLADALLEGGIGYSQCERVYVLYSVRFGTRVADTD